MRKAIESYAEPLEDWDSPGLQAEARPSRLRTLEHEHSLSALLQGHLQKSPEALAFFDWRGVLLYRNTNGEAQFERWNRALPCGQETASLPAALRPGFVRSDRSLQLRHPHLPGLSASLDPYPDGFVLRFSDQQTLGGTAEFSAQALAALKKLTPSEQRVARLAVEGLRNDQIAKRLSRSPRTIEFQLHCAFRKLGVSNRVQLSRLLS